MPRLAGPPGKDSAGRPVIRARRGSMRPALPPDEELFGAARSSAYDRVVLGETGADAVSQSLPAAEKGVLAYAPARSINPERPRTKSAYYNPEDQIMTVRFRDNQSGGVGAPTYYAYYDVPPNVWRNYTRAKSPGKFINRTLNNYRYAPVDRVQ